MNESRKTGVESMSRKTWEQLRRSRNQVFFFLNFAIELKEDFPEGYRHWTTRSRSWILAGPPTNTFKYQLREAFQSKKQPNLGISPNRGGSSKNQKSPKFQLGKVQN